MIKKLWPLALIAALSVPMVGCADGRDGGGGGDIEVEDERSRSDHGPTTIKEKGTNLDGERDIEIDNEDDDRVRTAPVRP